MGPYCAHLLVLMLVAATVRAQMKFNISSQMVKCAEEDHEPTNDCRWKAGLHVNVDQVILGKHIAAYKIKWSTGEYSDWYVPGINDIDTVFNELAEPCSIPLVENSIRRVWASFYDHEHKYIVCPNSASNSTRP